MLLTITTTHHPATDLGYLLGKNPARAQSFELPFGAAHVFYPQAGDDVCTAALLLDVDPVGLVRGAGTLDQYVNDRPYAASSFLSVAVSRVLRSALAGSCRERPELAATPIPLVARIAVLPVRGGEPFLRRLFEPLGYDVTVERLPLDDAHPEWGESRYLTVALAATKRLAELLAHLYVLVPVLDNAKHYWVGDDEVEKLVRHGEGWLGAHPERELIVHEARRARLRLLHGSLVYRDRRLEGFDAAAVVEVIEHLDPPRLAAFERAVFGGAQPGTIVLTTPNAEYNVRWPSLPAGRFRHRDHRFEWTRAELAEWADAVAARHGYSVRYQSVGPVDDEVGSPTQMAVFTRSGRAEAA